MNDTVLDKQSLEARLLRLEKQNTMLRMLSVGTLILLVAIVTIAASLNDKNGVIEGHTLLIRDANGVARVEVGKDGFFVNNEDGKHRISIMAGKDNGTGIALFADDSYKKQVLVGIQEKLNFCGVAVNHGDVNRILMTTVDGKPKLELQDEHGKPFFQQAQP